VDINKKNFNLFQLNTELVPKLDEMSDSDFEPASKDEKKSMVEMRRSVSYWADAHRRFRANKVSMVALYVFIFMLLFTFVGPSLIPYNYSDQYRDELKLGPFQYSEQEQRVRSLLKDNDAVYATTLIPGSLTSISAGDYYITYKRVTYAFHIDSTLADSVIILNTAAQDPLTVVTDKALKAGKSDAKALASTSAPAEGAVKLKAITYVFPHVFGTDSVGRDLMARCMYGGRVSLIVGIIAALIVLIIGATYGAVAGLAGGVTDFIMMRIVDIIYSVPDVLIVLLLQVILKDPLQKWFDTFSSTNAFVRTLSDLGVGIVSIFITFALLYWVGMSRIIRGQVLQLKQQEYVTAANALGVPNRRIIKRHLLPNCVGQLVITTCLQIPSAIFLESFLSFLGLGVSAPMASLGSLCSDALDTITIYPYRLLFPAVILTILVLSLNLIGDGLRDALDPRLKK